MKKKLTLSEANLLKEYVKKNGGQVAVGAAFGVDPCTLSRNVNRRTAPSPMLRSKLIEAGVVKA